MKTICVASATGGTGKSLVAAVLGKILPETILADLSFSQGGLRTYAGGEPFRIMEHSKTLMANRFERNCVQQGACLQACPVGAIHLTYIDPCLCNGCGQCIASCSQEALYLTPNPAGRWYYADTAAGLMLDTDLVGANDFDADFALQVYGEAQALASARQASYLIVDTAAGFGETEKSIMQDADLVLLVSQPSQKEMIALEHEAAFIDSLGSNIALCINKATLSSDFTMALIDWGIGKKIKTAGKIDYDEELLKRLYASMEEKQSFFGLMSNELKAQFAKLMVTIQFIMKEG